MTTIAKMNFPIDLGEKTKLWVDPADLDPMAIEQIWAADRNPHIVGQRTMPDAHGGYGVTVGCVLATNGAVSPAAVGVDIGCGMSAIRTSLTANDLPDDLGPLRSSFESVVPVGFNSREDDSPAFRRSALRRRVNEHYAKIDDLHIDLDTKTKARARSQYGTLGGGNHFIELCLDDDDQVWIMLHSGSRYIGGQIGLRHIDRAKKLAENASFGDLAMFHGGTPEMDAYMADLYWAQEYAALNRAYMTEVLKDRMVHAFGGCLFPETVSCHHNYVAEETYEGQNLIITRKGAIRVGAGELGLIPGSMATGSYVVRGLGNPASYQSASHGAGRVMSRTKAKAAFDQQDVIDQTAGIECRKDLGIRDELPAAYKDLAHVVAAQTSGEAPLVEVVTHLRTQLCVKG